MTQFNLFCNTTSGLPSENPDTNTNAKILPDLIDICEDDGVRYLGKSNFYFVISPLNENSDL